MLTGFFQDSDFIVVLQTGFGSGFLPLKSELESDSKKLESEHLWYRPVVYGYGNFAILIQSEIFSSTPYPKI